MEMAKVTSKGQITIPVSIRKRLSINEGDKVLFLETSDGVVMVNPDVWPMASGANDGNVAAHAVRMDADIPDGVTNNPESGIAMQTQDDEDRDDATAKSSQARESGKPPLHENRYDVNKLLDEIRSFREKY